MASNKSQIKTLLILGASGDLTARLLLPGLGQLLSSNRGHSIKLIGAAIDPMTKSAWTARVRKSFATVGAKSRSVTAALDTTQYVQADITSPQEMTKLLAMCDGVPAIYFALPPAITAKTVDALQEVDLPTGTVLLMEKPFGVDEQSAKALNKKAAALVPENQIHRVDHFLGKSTVLNFLGVRFANRIFEASWSNLHIERIDIVFDESLALENRARYYDKAGALVDMIQSHLLQVLALMTCESPATTNADDLRDSTAQALRATRLWKDDPITAGRRARYTAGKIGSKSVPSYVKEPGIDPSRKTETLAELTVEVRTARWAGVPITLRSGKAMGADRFEALVTYKPVSHLPTGLKGTAEPNVLKLGLGEHNTISLCIDVNGPGDPFELGRANLFSDPGAGEFEAYGEVLLAAIDGDPSLSVRGDMAEQCWRIVDPVLRAWRADKVPLQQYKAGSTGPKGWMIE